MIFNLASGEVSPTQNSIVFGSAFKPWYLMVSGSGTLAVEILSEDETWRSFPETTFEAPAASFIELPEGDFRFKAEGGSLIVEVR